MSFLDKLYNDLIELGLQDDELTDAFKEATTPEEVLKKLGIGNQMHSGNTTKFSLMQSNHKTKQEKIDWTHALNNKSQTKPVEKNLPKKEEYEIKNVEILKEIKRPEFLNTEKPRIQVFDSYKQVKRKLRDPFPNQVFPRDLKKSDLKFYKTFSDPKTSYKNSKRFSNYSKQKDNNKSKANESLVTSQGNKISQILVEKVEIKENQTDEKFFFDISVALPTSLENFSAQGSEFSIPINLLSSSIKYDSEDLKENSNKKIIKLKKPDANDPVAPDPPTEYFQQMCKYRVIQSTNPDNFKNFSFPQPVNLLPNALKRVTKELDSLSKNLPCSPEASIFLMYDHQDIGKIKLLILGPSETPYAHGFFLFDVRIPENYPKAPPLVKFCTAGNEGFQFGPNFLKNGELCLSLINTWKGEDMERWNSSSTLLQLFVSIQSLAMGTKIIQKNPKFEKSAENSEENKMYQIEVKYGTLKYALLDSLKNPPQGFEEIFQTQISLTKSSIEKTLSKWIKSSRYFKPCPEYKSDNPEICKMLFQSGFKSMHSLFLQLIEILNLNILEIKI